MRRFLPYFEAQKGAEFFDTLYSDLPQDANFHPETGIHKPIDLKL